MNECIEAQNFMDRYNMYFEISGSVAHFGSKQSIAWNFVNHPIDFRIISSVVSDMRAQILCNSHPTLYSNYTFQSWVKDQVSNDLGVKWDERDPGNIEFHYHPYIPCDNGLGTFRAAAFALPSNIDWNYVATNIGPAGSIMHIMIAYNKMVYLFGYRNYEIFTIQMTWQQFMNEK